MKCRVLYLIGQLHTGGSERQLYHLLKRLDRDRYKPAVVAWNKGVNDQHVPMIHELGVPIYHLATNHSGPAKLKEFCSLAQQLQPEVIHSYSFYTNFAAYFASIRTRALPIGSVRGDFNWSVDSAGYWLGRVSARWPKIQILNSYIAAEAVSKSKSPFVPHHAYVVWNAVDLQQLQNTPLPKDKLVTILAVGYLLPVKRWDRLLNIASDLKRLGAECVIKIAGDGPLRTHLEQQAYNLNVTDRVEFLGYTNDVATLFRNATFLVHTADNEGCPNAIMEAMASGRAVVAMNAGDVPLLIEDGKTGFVVQRGDYSTVVDRMVRLINSPELCESMGAAGREKAEREFGSDRLVRETFDVYRSGGWIDA